MITKCNGRPHRVTFDRMRANASEIDQLLVWLVKRYKATEIVSVPSHYYGAFSAWEFRYGN